ncbi:pyruvate kinase [Desulfohalobium retbaense]|uniref:Pyruvate kinase n=1 Tax=Desulfohalobium retbaense (strain ATCC 49708 / DSM 5692 / JCM 16813 / HR100) TaxID=485915 RepID=C8X539_DESRD|nr:pyruvate kinase [Desulfohalobium retbaense]ACV69536.1 pyruvate kinase [Desulfohalobium retbaense DSM 5692]
MRTNTIVTLGPASMQPEILRQLAEQGVRIFRLNFSHGDAAYFSSTVAAIRDLEGEIGHPLTIMADLCGPKIRIGELPGSPVHIAQGTRAMLGPSTLQTRFDPDTVYFSLDMPEVLNGLQEGMPVYLSDGMLRFEVVQVHEPDRLFELEARNRGIVTSHKGIAFPGKEHKLSALTDKDRRDLDEAVELGVDAVALSFVQDRQDIMEAREAIARHRTWIPVVAKLERKSAVDNLESILAVADAVMVARGDLGLECPLATLPVLQKRIIRACRHAQKAVIVATQMLLSMVSNPVPTRAETTDVANAVLDGADCVMLSEETAVGEYPVEAVQFIREITESAETYFLERVQGPYPPKKEHNPAKYLAYAATLIAENMKAKALVSHSTSGMTARLLSSRRPALPVYALTPEQRVVRALNFFWGVRPRLADERIDNHLERVQEFVQRSQDFEPGESVILTSGQPTPGQTKIHTNEIKVYYK